MPSGPSARRTAVALGSVALALVACGEGDEEETTTETSAAAELCRDYRLAVAAVRSDGTAAEQSADFTAAADAARAAREGTAPEDLTTGGEQYLAALDEIAGAYDGAAEASEQEDQDAYFAALDVAEPADDAIDGLAGDGGLEGCALGEVGDDEQGVSQSGFPALAVPADAVPVPPQGNTATYSLPDAAIRIIDVGPADAGTVPPADSAAAFERALGAEFASLERAGESGNDLVPMTEFRYEFDLGEGDTVPGIAHVFSGQGKIWALDCAGSDPAAELSPELEADCGRAVETLGFLMF